MRYMYKTLIKKRFLAGTIIIFCSFFSYQIASASPDGYISTTNYQAQVCENAECIETSTSAINFGNFSTNIDYPARVTDTELLGYIWGEGVGWVVLNCNNTETGCSDLNADFKVINDGDGNLSGYAWGEATGWINFGPFVNTSTPSVTINEDGKFNGYAWSQNFGWIKFDCSLTNYCVQTSWAPPSYKSSNGSYIPQESKDDKEAFVLNTEIIPVLKKLPKFPFGYSLENVFAKKLNTTPIFDLPDRKIVDTEDEANNLISIDTENNFRFLEKVMDKYELLIKNKWVPWSFIIFPAGLILYLMRFAIINKKK